MFQLPDGRVVSPDADFELNGLTYIGGVRRLSTTDRAQLNITDVVAPAPVDTRYFYVNSDGTSQAKPWEQIKSQLIPYLANKRWTAETSGMMFGPMLIPTDDIAQRKISELRRRAQAGEIDLPFGFKTPNSGFVDLDLATITALDQSVAAHIQACYAKEREVLAEIEADPATVTTFEQIDAAFAPLIPTGS